MKIFTDIDLLPNLQKYISLIDESSLYYKQHGLKHPSAIYNSSFGKIEGSLKDVLESHISLLQIGFENKEKDVMPDLLKNYRQLLYALREHLDDCFHVVKAFVEPNSNYKDERNQYLWLHKNVPQLIEDFFQNISEYKKYLDLSVNELKHNNGILGSVSFFSSNSSDACSGYYVANVVDDCYEPVEKIHPRFQTMHTAFSFRRDLAFNIYNIYALAEEMSTLLREKLNIDFETLSPNVSKAPENRRQMFQTLMDMTRIHFPDEYFKPIPSISLTSEETLKLEYPSQLSIKPNRLDRVVLTHSTDGHTAKYRILYSPIQ